MRPEHFFSNDFFFFIIISIIIKDLNQITNKNQEDGLVKKWHKTIFTGKVPKGKIKS